MKFDVDRRIANAVRRVHAQIDGLTEGAHLHVEVQAESARAVMRRAFNTAARSLGQSRRYRNQNGGR